MEDPNKDITILETMNKELSIEKEKSKALDQVEDALIDFVKDAFDVTRDEFEFNKQVNEHILSRLNEFNPNQLIALTSNAGVNSADKIAKTMNPWVQLATARQQAQIAADAAERSAAIQTGQSVSVISGGTLKDLNQNAPKEVLQGMDALSKLISVVTDSARKQIEEEKKDKEEIKEEKKE